MNPAERDQGTAPGRAPGSLSEWLHTWRYFFWLLGLVAVVALFYAEENWRGSWLWERYKHRLAAHGERLEGSAFVPPTATDDENFAMTPLLSPLFGFSSGSQQWRNPNALRTAQGFAPRYDEAAKALKAKTEPRSNSWVAARIDLAAWQAAFLKSTNAAKGARLEPLATNSSPEGAAATVLAALSECDPVFEELRTASCRPRSRFNLNYENEDPAAILLPHLSVLKHFCQVLQLRACAELALGRTDDAFNDTALMLSLADACREEPILISHLVRFAQLQLALQPLAEGIGQWSEPQLRAFEERLRGFDFLTDIRRTFQAERAFFVNGEIDHFRRSTDKFRLVSGIGNFDGRPSGAEFVGALMTVAPSGWLYLEQLSQSRINQDFLLPTIDLANREIRPDAARQAEKRIAKLTNQSPPALFLRHEFFSALMIPAIPRVVRKAAFAQTAADAARVACALERQRLAGGRFPDSLDSLVPQFIDKLPHDVINGQPLKYRRDGDRQYLLYSVGWNETDDGGKAGVNEKGDAIVLEKGDWVWRGLGAATR